MLLYDEKEIEKGLVYIGWCCGEYIEGAEEEVPWEN